MTKEQAIKFQTTLLQSGIACYADGIVGPQTLSKAQEYVVAKLKEKSMVTPEKGLVWLRTDEVLTNTFDDYVVRFNGGVIDMICVCTTTAGDYYVNNPVTSGGVTGTAIACEQQIMGSHKFVSGKDWKKLWLNAPYFQQKKPIKIFRDNDKDKKITKVLSFVGLFGINFHRMGLAFKINNWSAGCHGCMDNDWYNMINIFENGEKIDYTLINI